jgi:hypothetical protein
MERQLGSVIFFKGVYGFISSAEGISYFFHIRNVKPLADGGKHIPRAGDLFCFTLQDSKVKPGRKEAAELELARRADSTRPEVK